MEANFYYFKESGKFYTEAEGHWPNDPNEVGRWFFKQKEIAAANEGTLPGLSGARTDLLIIVVPKPDCAKDNAWPRLIKS